MMLSSTLKTPPPPIPEIIDRLPNISGWEKEIAEVVNHHDPVFLPSTNIRLENVSAAFAIALHLHQPTIPAGANGELISNLLSMFDDRVDNHKARALVDGYSRMADLIPELVADGCKPRIMLDFSGNLLWGLRQIKGGDILEKLKRIGINGVYRPYVEWLGTMWSHAVLSSTPIPDIKLHIKAWQHHFAAIFGWEALSKVKGFSPPELALPNHPDTLFEFVKALKEAGYRWLLVKEHSLETLTGQPLQDKHLPHRLIARNSYGETLSITVLIATQGSNPNLVGQMQPYYDAKTLSRQMLGTVTVPPLVTQMGEGENGSMMIDEFPNAFQQVWYEMARQVRGKTGVVAMNGTEYLELIEAAGCMPEDYPACQAVGQHHVWERVSPERCTPEAVTKAIEQLKQTNPNFHMDAAAWTNHLSWVKDYENVLTPMSQLSALFHQKIDPLLNSESKAKNLRRYGYSSGVPLTKQSRYREALMNNLLLQTSCFRYDQTGIWADYALEIYRRAQAQLQRNF
jgi:hypothetical protein